MDYISEEEIKFLELFDITNHFAKVISIRIGRFIITNTETYILIIYLLSF